jgi:hypothetical protein
VTRSSILAWRQVYGDRAVHYAECAIGTFRTRSKGARTVLTLNNVVIGDHRDSRRARKRADRLIEATAEHLVGRSRRQPAVPVPEAAPSPEPVAGA